MIEEKKSNKKIIIIVGILILVALIFIFTRQNISFGPWTDIDTKDEKFYSVYSQLYDYTYMKSRKSGYKDFSDEELAKIAFSASNMKPFDVTIVSESEIDKTISFSLDKIDQKVNELFGNKASINYSKVKTISFTDDNVVSDDNVENNTNDIFKCSFTKKSYNKKENRLTGKMLKNCNWTEYPHPTLKLRKIVSAKQNDNMIEVKEKVIYYEVNFDNIYQLYNVYSDPAKSNYLGSVSFDETTAGDSVISVDDYIDNAATIIHKYKLNEATGEYYFISSQIY